MLGALVCWVKLAGADKVAACLHRESTMGARGQQKKSHFFGPLRKISIPDSVFLVELNRALDRRTHETD